MSGYGKSYIKNPPYGDALTWSEREFEAIERGIEDAAYGLRWDDLRFAAGAIRVDPAGLVASPAIDNVEADVPGTLLFSGTVDNLIADVAQLPHRWKLGSTIRPHIHWAKTSASANVVTWEFYYRILGNVTDAFGAWSSAVTRNSDAATTIGDDTAANTHLLTSFGDITMTGTTMGGVMSSLIRRNTTIPASAKEMFTTYVDGPTGVDIHILQGERELAKDNRSLARFRLKVPPLPAGVPRIEVTFLIDANGILNVKATDMRTGQSQSIEVKPSYGLADQVVERMIEDSFKFAADDVSARKLIEARLDAGALITTTEKTLADGGHLVSADDMTAIRNVLSALAAAKDGNDPRAIRARMAELEQAAKGLTVAMLDDSLKRSLQGKKVSDIT